MNEKKKFLNNSLWWLDYSIVNNGINFSHSKKNNIFFLKINNNTNFLFFLLNKYNLNTLYLYVLDNLIIKNKYYITYQSFFYDYKVLIQSKFKKNIKSISGVYNSMGWGERENKEFNKVTFLSLKDSRKLLSNYNYNNNNNYNNYSTIINDIKL
jgi:Ni,Fe-hydrogenase III component G